MTILVVVKQLRDAYANNVRYCTFVNARQVSRWGGVVLGDENNEWRNSVTCVVVKSGR